MFRITNGRGFHIEFENGYTVSVQFGPGNYCEHYHGDIMEFVTNTPKVHESIDAEVAVFTKDKPGLIDMPEFGGDTVGNRFSPKQVLDLLVWAESQEAKG